MESLFTVQKNIFIEGRFSLVNANQSTVSLLKQPREVFYIKKLFIKNLQYSHKKSVLESLFNKVADLQQIY